MPGPKKPILINGHKSKRAFIVVNPAAESGASLSLYSHAGVFKFAVTTDHARVKDPETLVKFFEEAIEEMLQ